MQSGAQVSEVNDRVASFTHMGTLTRGVGGEIYDELGFWVLWIVQ